MKFYRLTHEEYIQTLSLRSSERDLLFFLRTLDPFGDGFELVVSEIAEVMQKHRSTITRALHVLEEKGWINLEAMKVRVKVLPGKAIAPTKSAEPDDLPDEAPEENTTPEPSTAVAAKPDDVPTQQAAPPDTPVCAHTQIDAPAHRSVPTRNKSKLKPKQCKASNTPKTFSDYLSLLQTLSEKQRERFMDFCRRKADSLPNPVRMLEKWICANFDFLKAQYISETGETWGSSVRKKKIPTRNTRNPLPEKVVAFLQKAINDNKIKNFWFCEPLKRWMVLLDKGQMEVDIYLEKQGVIL